MRISDSIVHVSSPTTIQYTLVTNAPSYTNNLFHCSAFSLMQTLPIDLIQLQNVINNFEFSFRFNATKSYELFSFPSDFFNNDVEKVKLLFSQYSSSFNIAKIHVLIIDSGITNHSKISQFINYLDHAYFTVLPNSEGCIKNYGLTNYFQSAIDFIKLIRQDISKINATIVEHYSNTNHKIEIDSELTINPKGVFISSINPPGSNLEANNFLMLNQIIGNIWIGGKTEMSKFRTKPKDRTQRIIDQSHRIDNISMIMFNEVKVKPTDPFQPLLSTIVLIAPYHFPKMNKLHGRNFSSNEKVWRSISMAEQNLNYEHELKESDVNKVSKEGIRLIMENTSLKLNYLDSVGFIHARFSYSPIIRLPQIGKSINRELSHLEKPSSNSASTISNIEKFGKKLRDLTVSNRLAKYLKERNGQIFAISDLPVEWLFLDERPLCYTHDVCRLPEFNLNALVNSAIHIQRLLYEIPMDLINKTLIIHCSSKNDKLMNGMFDIIDGYKDSFGFESIRCSTVEKIKQAIHDFKPDLLIFDCHGGSSKNEMSSFLVIDDEKNLFLTGDQIVKHELSAPLVILSACETMPNYGYVKLISDAFMEAGAYCVTTTFLPIKIVDAATLMVRLLNNLVELKTKCYHNNWLNFMSHLLRTTLIFETVNKARKNLFEEITNDEIATILTKSMRFETRLLALKELDILISSRSQGKTLKFIELDNEWMFYSIIGRADLLYFKNWLKLSRELNFEIEKNSK